VAVIVRLFARAASVPCQFCTTVKVLKRRSGVRLSEDLQFDGDRICHMTKIWNDGISLKQLGWA
jgi:hypothetical protein